jgi:hypothetical protein
MKVFPKSINKTLQQSMKKISYLSNSETTQLYTGIKEKSPPNYTLVSMKNHRS